MKVPLDFDVALNKCETICPHYGVFAVQGPTSYPSVIHQGRCQENEPNILDIGNLLGFLRTALNLPMQTCAHLTGSNQISKVIQGASHVFPFSQ